VIHMPKSKPTQVIVHRIELQTSEREMLELAVFGNMATNTIQALSPALVALMDPVKLYGLLTILELTDILDTPLPTLGDLPDDFNAGVALGLIRDWVFGSADEAENNRYDQEVRNSLAHQATEALTRSEQQKQTILEEYQEDPTPENWERVQAAQAEENRIRGEQKKQADIAKGWKYWFRYEYGRWPKNKEVLAAKIRGDYYD